MATIREIKTKKNSVETINKITSSMELISITKSKHATNDLNRYLSYVQELDKIVYSLANEIDDTKEFVGTAWVVISSDFGLAGGFNNFVVKKLQDEFNNSTDEIISIGTKGTSLLESKYSVSKIKSFVLADIKLEHIQLELISLIINKHQRENKKIKVIYTEFLSQLQFLPKAYTLLPIEPIVTDNKQEDRSLVEYEPNKKVILAELIEIYLPSKIRFFIKNSIASEHTSRRIAMENATKNGEELIKNLSIQYNRIRQAKITQEILEILGGSEALKE